MKNFLKTFLACFLGSLVAMVIATCIFVFVLVGSIMASVASFSSNESSVALKQGSILKIDVNSLPETIVEDPFSFFAKSREDIPHNIALTAVLDNIAKAKNNPNIEGIYINTMDIESGWASVTSLRRALEDFKTSGKFIIAYADRYTPRGYFLASVADQVYVNPQGSVSFDGISLPVMFYKGLLDKVGVEMMVFKVGTYKSAVEPYILKEMSQANREQMEGFSSSLWSYVLGQVGKSRGLSVPELNAIVDRMPTLMPAEEYVETKLVDGLMYERDVLDLLAEKTEADEPYFLTLWDMDSVKGAKQKGKGNIGVVFAEGNIVESISPSIGSAATITMDVAKEIEEMAKDESIDAIVLRVNSPGGSAFTSEQIWYAVSKAAEKKPVVASMGDYAASGGYYISSGAHRIIAEPTTLTGSIGIFGMFPNVTGLFSKVGLSMDAVKVGKFADFGMTGRPMTEEEKALMQRHINRGYENFLQRVSRGRGISVENLDPIAQGRVWTGAEAAKIGLVDELGGIDKAFEAAARLAKITSYRIIYGKRSLSLWDTFMGGVQTHIREALFGSFLTPEEQSLLIKSKEMRSQIGIQARMPYIVD